MKLINNKPSRQHPEYGLWASMIQRCSNPNVFAFHRYGGRGIKVHPSWMDFETFLSAVGPRPSPLHTLDRVNNDGNYEPGNTRWATRKEQSQNTCNRNPVCGNCAATTNGGSRRGLCHKCNEYLRRKGFMRPPIPGPMSRRGIPKCHQAKTNEEREQRKTTT